LDFVVGALLYEDVLIRLGAFSVGRSFEFNVGRKI
jgi:hypothetical protein